MEKCGGDGGGKGGDDEGDGHLPWEKMHISAKCPNSELLEGRMVKKDDERRKERRMVKKDGEVGAQSNMVKKDDEGGKEGW